MTAQSQINHWESIVLASDTFKYHESRSYLEDLQLQGWRNTDFDDSAWSEGPGGFGFGDEDDATVILKNYSVYLRKDFVIEDLSQIKRLLLFMDYDDGFVAYINGVEVVRANMDPDDPFPPFNVLALSSHEAKVYRGMQPELFAIDLSVMESIMVSGQNTLSIQIHNDNRYSDDLTAIPNLIAGINSTETDYRPVPDWFEPLMQEIGSDIPIVAIHTDGGDIPDDPRILAWMEVIENLDGSLIYPFDEPTDYDGIVNIEKRGHSSLFKAPNGKHSLAFETQDSVGENRNVSILGMPKENDWILHGPYSDKTLIRNVLAYKFGRDVGLLTSRTRFVNLFINNEPQGIYVWMEKIKQDKNRVDITELRYEDLSGDQLTGGYIVKVDWPNNVPNEGWKSPYPPNNGTGQETVFVMQDPQPEQIHPRQLAYIRRFVTDFETVLRSDNFRDPIEGYRKYIDVDSWVDYFCVSELFRDTDAYRCSLYMYKDRDSKDGKLHLGPLWDYNYSMGNYEFFTVYSTEGWAYLFNYVGNIRAKINPFWYERLMEDEEFVNQCRTRWEYLRQHVLQTNLILDFIDQTIEKIERAATRNFQIWPVLDKYLWPNYYVGGTYENEITWLKKWLTDRAAWIDINLPGIIINGIYPDITSDRANIRAYPNPFTDLLDFQVQLNEPGQIRIILSNYTGQEIFRIVDNPTVPGNHNYQWSDPYSQFPGGLYFATVYCNNHRIKTIKLIKQ